MMTNAFVGENVVSCTLRDIARLTGVSTATVSRVANGAENVSCATRAKVLSAITRLQYCPNAHAAELGRAKGGIPSKRGIHVPTSTRTGTKLLSDPGADAQNERRKAERFRLLEDENSRLKRLVANLSIGLEMSRRDRP
jgi:transcriptional regulator with XRE-family HTH domain